jgi:arabinose operon protein AraL
MTASRGHLAIEGLIFDLDGTVYLGDEALPGAVECLAGARSLGKRTVFISNKPLAPRREYADKLWRIGIPTEPEDVLTSAHVLGHYLAAHAPQLRYYVIGETNLREELSGFGLALADELTDQDSRHLIRPDGIDAVVVAFDRTLDYRKLNTAYQALCRGARYFATNGDATCPVPGGAVPDAGATLAALHLLTGRDPELVAGKPSLLMIETALERMGLPANRCLMVGDRLETDIRMGRSAGMATALVLTGVTRREEVGPPATHPDLILDDLSQLLPLLR